MSTPPEVLDVMLARKRLREAEVVAVRATRRRDAHSRMVADARARGAEVSPLARIWYEELAWVADEAWLFWQVAHEAVEEAEARARRG